MSGPSTYNPKSGFERWLDSRLPLPRLMHDTMNTFPTPRNLNIWYTFGGILTFFLGIQILTGVVLAMHYVANAGMAFDSVEAIMRDVNYGWLMRYLHANGASMFFLAVYIHMFRGLYYGSYKAPRELIWIIGVLIYLLMMATAFFGYVLPWGQMSFWGATVITNLFSAIPIVGTHVATWLWGDFAVGDATLNRFFSLHYLLLHHRGGGGIAHLGPARARQQQSAGHRCEEPAGHGAIPSLLHRERRLLPDLLRDPVRGCGVLCSELLRQSGQLPAGQSVGDPAGHSAGMVPAALLRHAAFHPEQTAGRDRDGWRSRHAGLHSLAGHQPGALLPFPPADEAVLLGLRGRLRLAGLLRRPERGRGALRHPAGVGGAHR